MNTNSPSRNPRMSKTKYKASSSTPVPENFSITQSRSKSSSKNASRNPKEKSTIAEPSWSRSGKEQKHTMLDQSRVSSYQNGSQYVEIEAATAETNHMYSMNRWFAGEQGSNSNQYIDTLYAQGLSSREGKNDCMSDGDQVDHDTSFGYLGSWVHMSRYVKTSKFADDLR
jgi:hypothetical protein